MTLHRDETPGRADRRRAGRASRPAVDRLEGRALLATSAVVVDGNLSLIPVQFSATADATTGLVPVATILDLAAGTSPSPSNYQAMIAWGDGTYSDGVIAFAPSTPSGNLGELTGTVSGAHNYLTPGNYTVAVAISRGDQANSTTEPLVVTGTAVPGAQVLGVVPISATSGGTTGLVPVAAFVDPVPGPIPPAGQYSAAISWGDGTYSDGVVDVTSGVSNGSISYAVVQVSGSHTYTTPGTYGVIVALARPGAAYSDTTIATVGGTATPDQVLGVGPISATAGVPTGEVPITAFVDNEPAQGSPAASNYAAAIDWGDGTYTVGDVSIVGGTLGSPVVNVSGNHTYAEPGRYAIIVALARPGSAISSTTVLEVG